MLASTRRSKPPSTPTPPTPPHSSRSSFAKLPSTSTGHGFPSWTAPPNHSINDDEYDDDPEEEPVNEQVIDHYLDSENYHRLASLREPSPSDTLLFSAQDPEHFEVFPLDQARETEASLVSLTDAISSALTQYRSQFTLWELIEEPPESVIKASVLIDQCLAKFVYSLEPLKSIVDDLFRFGCALNQFHSLLSQVNPRDYHSIETFTKIWNSFSQLADHLTSVEHALSDSSIEINALCDWVDGLLTPALAEVKFRNPEDNSRVSQILDVHSYLCDSLVKTCTVLKIYQNCLKRLGRSIDRFQDILSGADDSATFSVHQAIRWSSAWAESLAPLVSSLAVLHAVCESIQVHSAGHLSSTPSGSPANSDSDSIQLLPNHTWPSSELNFLPHSISYV